MDVLEAKFFEGKKDTHFGGIKGSLWRCSISQRRPHCCSQPETHLPFSLPSSEHLRLPSSSNPPFCLSTALSSLLPPPPAVSALNLSSLYLLCQVQSQKSQGLGSPSLNSMNKKSQKYMGINFCENKVHSGSIVFSFLSFFLFFFFFLFPLGPHLWYMEVPWLGVESEL